MAEQRYFLHRNQEGTRFSLSNAVRELVFQEPNLFDSELDSLKAKIAKQSDILGCLCEVLTDEQKVALAAKLRLIPSD